MVTAGGRAGVRHGDARTCTTPRCGAGRRPAGRAGGPRRRVRELLRHPDSSRWGWGWWSRRSRSGTPAALEWWQVDPDGGRLRTLRAGPAPGQPRLLRLHGDGVVRRPRRTGRRHVVGPYVDVHGTGRYLLTLTDPVVVDGAVPGRRRRRRAGEPVRDPPAAGLGRLPRRSCCSTTRAAWCCPPRRGGWSATCSPPPGTPEPPAGHPGRAVAAAPGGRPAACCGLNPA